MEFKSVWDFPTIDDSFLFKHSTNYLLDTYKVTGTILDTRYMVSYIYTYGFQR